MPVRLLTAADRGLLREATLANMNWIAPRFTFDDIDASHELAHYFESFPGSKGFGFAEYQDSIVRGVAWLVFFPADDPGYGYVAPDIPELSITTFEGHRGRGVGAELLTQLVGSARQRGMAAISLSVEDGNPARRLYERVGFRSVGRNGGSATMLLDLE